MTVSTFPLDQAPAARPRTTAPARWPEAWERYLTGAVASAPEGFTGVREQLELYETLPAGPQAPAASRRLRRRPEVARPVPAVPGLDWQALRHWLELYCAHLLGLNRAPRTLEAYRGELARFFAACEAKGLTPRGLRRLDLLLYLAELARPPFATVPSPRVERHERRVLSEPEYQRLRQLARQVSSRTCAIPHHPFATHSLRKGVSLPVVQAVLGHSTLVSTERYLHLLRETMCAEVEQHAL